MEQIDLTAFADYALSTFDYSELFEDDEWAVTFEGVRIYVERKARHFNIHVGAERFKLPR